MGLTLSDYEQKKRLGDVTIVQLQSLSVVIQESRRMEFRKKIFSVVKTTRLRTMNCNQEGSIFELPNCLVTFLAVWLYPDINSYTEAKVSFEPTAIQNKKAAEN